MPKVRYVGRWWGLCVIADSNTSASLLGRSGAAADMMGRHDGDGDMFSGQSQSTLLALTQMQRRHGRHQQRAGSIQAHLGEPVRVASVREEAPPAESHQQVRIAPQRHFLDRSFNLLQCDCACL